MPTIHLIDVLLIAIVLAYVPVGARRGGFREGVLATGLVVTGALMISPPVNWLQDAVQDRASDGRQVVALVCLGVGLVLGVGAARVVERHGSSARGRLVGSFCGLANAIWICTFLLVELEAASRFSAFETWLAGGSLFRPLVSHNEEVLLALSTAGLFVSGLWTFHLIWARLGTEANADTRWTPRRRASSRHRAIHVPAGADSGKVEPFGARSSIGLSSTASIYPGPSQHQRQDYRPAMPRKAGNADRRGDNTATQRPMIFWHLVPPTADPGPPRDRDS